MFFILMTKKNTVTYRQPCLLSQFFQATDHNRIRSYPFLFQDIDRIGYAFMRYDAAFSVFSLKPCFSVRLAIGKTADFYT